MRFEPVHTLHPAAYIREANNPMSGNLHEGTVGYLVAADAAQPVYRPDGQPVGMVELANRQNHIDQLRLHMEGFSQPTRRLFKDYIKTGLPDTFAIQADKAAAEGQKWFDWLIDPEKARAPQLQRIATWHVTNMLELQDDVRIEEAAVTARDRAKTVLHAAIDHGRVSQSAASRLQKIDDIKIQVVDPFDPMVVKGAIGFTHVRAPIIAIAGEVAHAARKQRVDATIDNLAEVLDHEYAHNPVSSAEPGNRHWEIEEVGAMIAAVAQATVDATPHGLALEDPNSAYPTIAKAFTMAHAGPKLDYVGAQAVEKLCGQAHSGNEAEKTAYYEKLEDLWGTYWLYGRMEDASDKALDECKVPRDNLSLTVAEKIAGQAMLRLLRGLM